MAEQNTHELNDIDTARELGRLRLEFRSTQKDMRDLARRQIALLDQIDELEPPHRDAAKDWCDW